MKEQYIRQVEKELNLSRKAKTEVVRDLNEIFNSAVEHGETEQQVIERLGTPQEFANSTAEQFGIDKFRSKETEMDHFKCHFPCGSYCCFFNLYYCKIW